MPDTTPPTASAEEPPRRPRGAPRGNLNAYRDGQHARLRVDYSSLPPGELRTVMRAAVWLATHDEVKRLPRPRTSEHRRQATIRGLTRVLACLLTVDWSQPHSDARARYLFLLSLKPIFQPELARREERETAKKQKIKEQTTSEPAPRPHRPFVLRFGHPGPAHPGGSSETAQARRTAPAPLIGSSEGRSLL